MKNILVPFIILISSSLFAQNGLRFEQTAAVQNFDQSSFFSSLKKNIDGSFHLYKEWNKTAFVYTKDGQKLILGKVNFNIKDNVFQSQITKDSVFSFKINNFDRLELKDKVYKNLYANAKDKVYEVIYETVKLSIYKGYELEIVEASNDPMAGRLRRRYSQKSQYFSMQSNNFIPFRMSKKGILSLISDKDEIKKIQSFVKKNKLSFKKEDHLKRIFNYLENN